jgi:hypothetical protein
MLTLWKQAAGRFSPHWMDGLIGRVEKSLNCWREVDVSPQYVHSSALEMSLSVLVSLIYDLFGVEHMSCKSHVHIIIVMMTRDPIL